MKKPHALLVVLLLLAVITGIWISNAPDYSVTESQTGPTKSHADRNRRDLAGPDESPEARARRLSPPAWQPPAVFAATATPVPAIPFPRGENATRRYHSPQTIDLEPSLASRPPAILAQSPADGRFHLLPDEIDAHTRLARRMVFDPSALDSIVRQNTSRLLAPTIGDEVLTLELKTVKSRDANTHTLSGHIVGEESTSGVQLVYHDGILQGNVVRYTAAQEIEYRIMADGHMMVRELDQSTMTADCGNGPSTEAEAIVKDLSEKGISIQPEVQSGSVEGDTVGWRQLDVVVGYDAAARVAQGGYSQIEALIIASVDQMTLAFANSLIANSEAVLLATIEDPDYVYPGGTSGDMGSVDELGDLENRTDGLLDTVSGYATQLGADFVSFVLKDADGSAGIAYRPGRSSIVARTYMSSTRITFAHELGHNLGCDHSWGDSAQSYYAHYGWRLDVDGSSATTSDRVRTIMAYDWAWGSGVRIPYYANPNVSYNGAPTGAPNGHDVRTDTKGDQRYLQNGLNYTNGVFGFDGTQTALGANNANTVNTGAGNSSYGLTYASNRAARTAFNVTSPTTGAQWERGSTKTVFFTGGDEDDVATIQLYKGGVFQTDLATNRNVATGRSFPWAIPMAQALGADYMIRVSMTRNGSTITADSGTFSIIDATPMVISQTPASSPTISTPVSQIALTFNMTMNPASFAVADDVVSFTGPGAIDLKASINSAVWSSGNTVLTLGFPSQSATGSYQLVLGPQILSSTGVLMNQDQDTTTGESTQDRYTASFSVFTLAEALDTTGLTWTTSGNANWFGQTTTTQDGVDAAQSGDITDSQTSSVQTTLTGPGTLTYYWKVSSENNYDWLQFHINDVLQTGAAARISGEVAWTQVSVPIASGAQTVRWTYQKDSSVSSGSDAAWLDRVEYIPAAAPEIAVEQPVGTDLTDGSASINFGSVYAGSSSSAFTFTIRNTGNANLTGLALSKSGAHSADYTLGSLGAATLAPGASTTFTATFSPGAAGTRTATIQIANNDSNENPFDINLTGTGLDVGTLDVTAGGFASAGTYGGPFSPSSKTYTLTNVGTTAINWSAAKTQSWVTLSAASGTLNAGASTTLTASINSGANTLNAGSYSDTITFTNTTNGNGTTTRTTDLTVNPLPATVSLGNLLQYHDGSPKPVSVTTTPSNLAHAVTYNGSTTVPSNAGTYAVVATITAPNYAGSANGNLVIVAAVHYTWGGGNLLWNNTTASGWNGGPPLATDTATINSGTVTFAASDTYGNAANTSSALIRVNTGGTLASGGKFNSLWNLALGGGTLLSNGGVNADYGTFNLAGTVTVSGGVTSSISTGSGSNNIINLGNGSASALTNTTFNVGAAGTLHVGTVLQNHRYHTTTAQTSIAGLIKDGSGIMNLNATNTYTGGTTINLGTLTLGHATNTLSDTGAVHVNGGTLALGTNTDTVGAVTLSSGSITGSGTGKLTGTGSAFDVRSGTISAKLGGTVGLTKTTAGTVTISSDNSTGGYTGATTISEGKLFINGDQTGATGNVSVSANATLGGTGIIGGNTTISAGGCLEFDLSTNAASHNKLDIASGKTLTFSGASTLTITSSGGAAVGSYVLLSAPGGLSVTTLPTLILPNYWTATVSKVGTDLVLNVTAVTPFEQWAVASGLSGGNAASGADPDGDGWNNLQEFAFGTLPKSAVRGPLEFVPGGEVTKTGSPALRGYTPPQGQPPYQAVFGRRKNHAAAGLTYTAEFSANLTYWTASNSGASILTGAGSHEIEVVAVPFPETVPLSLGGTTAPPKFFRIRVAPTP